MEKNQFTNVLISTYLLGFVDGYVTCPPQFCHDTNVVNPLFLKFVRLEKFVMGCISSSFSASLQVYVSGMRSSQETLYQI